MNKPNKPKPSSGKSKSLGEKKFGKNPTAKSVKKNPTFKKTAAAPKPKAESNEIRLNKYIANSGVCSRREADVYISSGNVKVNGEVVMELGYKVKPTDKVVFDGVLLNPEKKEYVLLNKPKNFSTSANATQNNVENLIKGASKNKLFPIGRMDSTTTGLLLFTNDHDLIAKFTQESQRSSKIYQVSLDKNLKFEDLEKIQNGLTVDDRKIYVEDISYIENQPKTEIGLKVRTSNIKIVRIIFEKLGYDVLKVDRVTFAGLTKKNLSRGMWRYLTEQEVINLKNL